MGSDVDRRSFFKKLAAAGAVSAGVCAWPQRARADFFHFTYKLHGDGWDDYNRRGIVKAAMDLVGNMSYTSVVNRAYRLSSRYHLTGGLWDRTNPGIAYRGAGYADVLRIQLANLDETTERPVVNVRPYYSDDFSWGRANLDLVTLKFGPRTFQLEGEFDIQLNFSKLGGGGVHSSPAAWAGLIAHEMLHNLGHGHKEGEYDTGLQINALQQAVYEAGRGSEDIVAARHFRCGGRVR